jgi:predicted metal-dependent phosphotriesterase family hydrolase
LGETTVDQQRRAGTVATHDHVRASSFAIGDPATLAVEAVTFEQFETRPFEPAQAGVEVDVDYAPVNLGRKPPGSVVVARTRSALLHIVWDAHGRLPDTVHGVRLVP